MRAVYPQNRLHLSTEVMPALPPPNYPPSYSYPNEINRTSGANYRTAFSPVYRHSWRYIEAPGFYREPCTGARRLPVSVVPRTGLRGFFGSIERAAKTAFQPMVGGGLLHFLIVVKSAVNRVHSVRAVNRASFQFELQQAHTHNRVGIAILQRVIAVTCATEHQTNLLYAAAEQANSRGAGEQVVGSLEWVFFGVRHRVRPIEPSSSRYFSATRARLSGPRFRRTYAKQPGF